MSLITDIEKLRELEQKATPGDWFPGYLETRCIAGDGGRGEVVLRKTNGGEMPIDENLAFICKSRNLAPAMISVLECFREGDAETLGEILDVFQFDGEPMSGVYADCISRLQNAASLMEKGMQEEREG